MLFNSFIAEADGGEKPTSWWGIALMVIVVVALFVVIFVLPMFNNKKQSKKYQSLLDTVKIGDTVKTIGGIIGTVIALQTVGTQREFVLLTGTGDNKVEMVFDINALYQIVDPNTHEAIPMQPVVADQTAKGKKGKKGSNAVEESIETPFDSAEQAVIEGSAPEAADTAAQEAEEVGGVKDDDNKA